MTTKTYEMLDISNEIFLQASPEIRKTIVDVGCSVYDNLHFLVDIKANHENVRVKELQKQLSDALHSKDEYVQEFVYSKNMEINILKTGIEECNEFFGEKIKKEREYYTNQIEVIKQGREDYSNSNVKCKENEIEYLKNNLSSNQDNLVKIAQEECLRLERLEANHKRYVDSLNDQICQLKNLCEMQENQLKENFSNKHMNVVKMGQIGEASVEEYISKHFMEGTLQNTAKTGGRGDLHYTYKERDILLEVKNKDRITPDDIAKFERDVKMDTLCAGGVFISIKPCVNIPCHSCYDVEWLNDKPIIYISSFETIPDMLYVAIKTIFYYDSKKGTNEDEFTKYKEELDSLIDNVKLFKPILEDASTNMKKSLDAIGKLQNIIKTQLMVYFNNEEGRGNKLAIILKMCNKFCEDNDNKFPTYEELAKMPGISRKDIGYYGGMQVIKEEFKNK
jgi:hypothetical protein